MLLDARALTNGTELQADVCVVGAGVAGITIARELVGTPISVCVLESGDRNLDRRARDAVRGPSTGYTYYRHTLARARAFGGSSRLWPLDEGWRARPLDPIDFERRPGIEPSGWPLEGSELTSYYAHAQAVCDLGPADYDVTSWEDSRTPRLALDSQNVQTTMFQLGSTDFSRYIDELRHAENVKVVLRATVIDIRTDENPQVVDRVTVANGEGGSLAVRAKVFVLATGGIDNARLLLASNGRHAQGLGNQHDLVGRYFMERLSTRSGVLIPADPALAKHAGLYITHHVGTTRVEGTLRLDDAVIRREQLLNCVFFLLPRSRAFTADGVRSIATLAKGLQRQPRPGHTRKHVANIVRDLPQIAALARERLPRPASAGEQVLAVRPQAEQLPNPASRVRLDHRRDRFGLPRAHLEWRLSEDDRRSIRRTQELLDAELRRAGVGRLEHKLGSEEPPAMFEGNKHHMGTTRMADDPKEGVVDRNGRVHATANLYIAGSSVFPTAGASNPTLTIVALALRLAEHLGDVVSVRHRVEVEQEPSSPPASASDDH